MDVERVTGFGFLLAFGVGVALAVGVAFGLDAVFVAFTVGLAVGVAVVFGVAFGCTAGCGVGVSGVACRCACGVGEGVARPGIASKYGALAGSALAEFRKPLRPDQDSANAVNATTTTAKATNINIDRRGHLPSSSLNTGTG